MHRLLDQSAAHNPHKIAVEDGDQTITYRNLSTLSDRLRDRLHHMSVRRGDRVGIYMRKSIDAVAALFGVLKAGAAYVPVDPDAPPSRNTYILMDCSVRLVIVEERFEQMLRAELERYSLRPSLLVLHGGEHCLKYTLDQLEQSDPAALCETVNPTPDELAYILYTSGSTGKPKGVMLSRRNAMSFINWCSDTFQPEQSDRFSSHAPFHFDLSILDIFVPIKHGATLVLISAIISKDPARLAALIADKGITSWYSTPSVLSVLAQYGRMAQHDYGMLRMILFAGEVFPIKHLRALKQLVPTPRYFNLYGPTETNVCTYYEVPARIPDDRIEPYPIGKVCAHLKAKVVNVDGRELDTGQEGELCITGPGVMEGYWNLPQQTAAAFLDDSAGDRWYKTGDIVVQDPDGNYTYIGRRDRMIKKRGYRVELGEIEKSLYRHPAISEVAVIAFMDDDLGVQVGAFLTCKEGEKAPSFFELKRFCAEHLPIYMIPDRFTLRDVLPKTSTDKIDYQKLKEVSV